CYPRLAHGTAVERTHEELSGGGYDIHWPGLDEDVRVANLLEGRRSGEGERSFRRWRAQGHRGRQGRPSVAQTLALAHPPRLHRIGPAPHDCDRSRLRRVIPVGSASSTPSGGGQ